MRQITRETDPRVGSRCRSGRHEGTRLIFSRLEIPMARVMTAMAGESGRNRTARFGSRRRELLVRRREMALLPGFANGVFSIKKANIDGGQKLTVRSDNAIGCAAVPEGSVLFYAGL